MAIIDELPGMKVPRGIDAAMMLMDTIVPELSMHSKRLKLGWKVVATPPEQPIGCEAPGRSCKWLVYVGDSHESGATLLWNYFVVDAQTGHIWAQDSAGASVELSTWRASYAVHPD